MKNVSKRKNPLTEVKLESKKRDKKSFASREGLGEKVYVSTFFENVLSKKMGNFIFFFSEKLNFKQKIEKFNQHFRNIHNRRDIGNFLQIHTGSNYVIKINISMQRIKNCFKTF